jgi:hypothetical protein
MLPVRSIARTPPPAFLFPNQRCQRPEPACRPHRLTPGGRRRRRSSRLGFPCQPALSGFFSRPTGVGLERKNHSGPRRGFPQKSVAIRLESRRIVQQFQKIKEFLSSSALAPPCPRPESGLSMALPPPCQRPDERFIPVLRRSRRRLWLAILSPRALSAPSCSHKKPAMP